MSDLNGQMTLLERAEEIIKARGEDYRQPEELTPLFKAILEALQEKLDEQAAINDRLVQKVASLTNIAVEQRRRLAALESYAEDRADLCDARNAMEGDTIAWEDVKTADLPEAPPNSTHNDWSKP